MNKGALLGSIKEITSLPDNVNANKVFQVIQIYVGMSKDGSKKIGRMKLWDGAEDIMAMVLSQHLSMLEQDENVEPMGANLGASKSKVKLYNLVKLLGYSQKVDASKRFLIVSDFEIVDNELDVKLETNTAATSESDSIAKPKAVPQSPITPEKSNEDKSGTDGTLISAVPSWKSMGSGAIVRSSAPLQPLASSFKGSNAPQTPLANEKFRPIASLNPYTNQWVVRGKVIQKSNRRNYQTQRGDGTVISFALADTSGSIQVTAFNKSVELVENLVEIGRYVAVSNAVLKPSNSKYNRTDSSYEMTLTERSRLEVVEDAHLKIKEKLNLVEIQQLRILEPKRYCDVLGVVTQVDNVTEFVAKSTGDHLKKRSITLVDQSNASVVLSLWGDQVDLLHSSEGNPILLCKGVRRGEYNGVTLDTGKGSQLEINPEIPNAEKLREWYKSHTGDFAALSNTNQGSNVAGGLSKSSERKLLDKVQAQAAQDLESKKASYASCRARISYIRSGDNATVFYPSCPNDMKKVHDIGGMWNCEACSKQFEKPVYRYVMSMTIIDSSTDQRCLVTDEAGRVILGMTADELHELQANAPEGFNKLLRDLQWKPFVFKIRSKEDSYKDKKEIRYQVIEAKAVDFATESKILLEEIKAFEGSA